MFKRIVMTAVAVLMLCGVCQAEDLSQWAQNDYNKLNTRGVLCTDIIREDLHAPITRGEFCKIVTNIYETKYKIFLYDNDKTVFTDTTDESVLKAYKIGVVTGRDDGAFYPAQLVTRQEMAAMISRLLKLVSGGFRIYENQIPNFTSRFSDSLTTDDWAMEDMAAVASFGIINGDDQDKVNPKNNATREEAICMLGRACETFVEKTTVYQPPKITKVRSKEAQTHTISVWWEYMPSVLDSEVIIKSPGETPLIIKLNSIDRNVLDINTGFDKNKEICVYVAVNIADGVTLLSMPVSCEDFVAESEILQQEIIKQEEETETQQKTDNMFSVIEYDKKFTLQTPKEQRVFPEGHYFETKEEALEYMTEVTVPVWTLKSDGTKVSGKKTLTVNTGLAEDVVSIFTEIYNDESQFPIKDVGGFSWRNTAGGSVSQHSYGTCIDINWNENYYVRPDGTPITGSHWLPGEDPYSIAEDSVVVKTFAKYDWKWGGNAWSDSYAKDYMHFTYLGK